jgi:hypothetical protein
LAYDLDGLAEFVVTKPSISAQVLTHLADGVDKGVVLLRERRKDAPDLFKPRPNESLFYRLVLGRLDEERE